jgi:hypothetical protein
VGASFSRYRIGQRSDEIEELKELNCDIGQRPGQRDYARTRQQQLMFSQSAGVQLSEQTEGTEELKNNPSVPSVCVPSV